MKHLKILLFYCILICAYAACPSFNFLASNNSCLPCDPSCSVCTNNTACTLCANGYFLNSTQCTPCLINCQTCSNASICSVCNAPYILTNSNTVCTLCTISYATSCSTLTNATTCNLTYYTQYTFCASCVLNCQSCTNSTNCVTCNNGYLLQYQNSVCSACSGCRLCTGTLTNCSSCWNGYQLASNSSSGQYNCIASSCNITNCLYCSVNNSCSNCNPYYYLVNNTCIYGSSLTCYAGALGSWPNQCAVNCSYNFYASNSSATIFSCIAYQQLSSNGISQNYYYMFNDYLNLYGTGTITNTQCSNQYYMASAGDITLNLSYYYKVSIIIKGYSLSSTQYNLSVSLSANSTTQISSISLNSSCQVVIQKVTSVQLHSNQITLSFFNDTNFGVIQLLFLTYKCSSNCISCLNTQLCLVCQSPLYQFQYSCISDCLSLYRLNQSNQLSCVSMCPSGYFNSIVNATNVCTACTAPCLTCSNSTTCFSCGSVNSIQYYYYNFNNTCLASCPAGEYATSGTCNQCITPCNQCLNATTCLSCIEGYWNNVTCTTSCPSGYFGNLNNHNCDVCNSSCLTCVTSSIYCTSCSSSLILFDNQCLSACLSGYYLNINTCVACVAPCNTCNSSTSCLSCAFGYLFNNSCVFTCPTQYYANSNTLSCALCNSSCSACVSLTYCTQCSVGYCLQLGYCVIQSAGCISSYFQNINNSICICTACSFPCLTCTAQLLCTSCITNYLFNNSCVSYCPSGYYGLDSTQICQTCASAFNNCLTCTSATCISCANTYIIDPTATNNSLICALNCPNNYYNNTNTCLQCVSPCLTCSSQTSCLTCITSYVLSNNQCLTACPTGYYASNFTCLQCQSPCSTCTNANTCLSCVQVMSLNSQTYLLNTSCLSNCPSTYYAQPISLQCEACLSPCATCTSQIACLSCSVGYLVDSKCEQCLSGTFANTTTLTCQTCPTNCSICSNLTYCSDCTNSTYLYNNTCVNISNCNSLNGFYAQNSTNVCQKCTSPCSTCVNSTACTSCLAGYIYYNSSCMLTCPSGYYSINSTCSLCSSQCLTCITSSSTCLTCSSNYFYYQYTCLSSCPNQTYVSVKSCLNCNYPCKTCTSATVCSSCVNGILYNSSCVTTCPDYYYSLVSNSVATCSQCDSTCLQCNGLSTNCTQCNSTSYLFNNTCLTSCPVSYFSDTSANMCFACISPCLYCSDPVTCLKCSNTYIYYSQQNQCVTTCPTGYYNTTNSASTSNDSAYICSTCMSICLTCSNAVSCIICNSGVMYQNTCLTSCPAGMYQQSGTCYNCTLPCVTCTGPTVCTSCPSNSGYLLVAGTSCIVTNTCPTGYYLIPNSTNCSATCPTGYYKSTLSNICTLVCPGDYFKGADYACYQSCPSNYFGNSTYDCASCNNSCPNVMNFYLNGQIITDTYYLNIVFTETPIYSLSVNSSYLTLTPSIPFSIYQQSSEMITLKLQSRVSLPEMYLKVSFSSSFELFSNQRPLQNPNQYYDFAGYDLYDGQYTDFYNIGNTFSILVLIAYLIDGYFGLDFAQTLFLFNIVDIHYPPPLRTFLQGFRSSNAYIPVASIAGASVGKFGVVVPNTSLLSNTLYIFLISAVYILLLGSAVLAYRIQKYFRELKIRDSTQPSNPQQPTKIEKLYNTLKGPVLYRLLYILYTYLALFTFSELSSFNAVPYNLASRYLSIISLMGVTAAPIVLWYYQQQNPRLLSLMLLRKYLICLCLVVAMNYPLYIVGIIEVINICSIVLIISYRPYEFKPQFVSCLIGEILQTIVTLIVVAIAFWGQGYHTQDKVYASYVLIVVALLTCLFYIFLNTFELVLWLIKQFGGKDYKAEWMKQQNEGQSDKQMSEMDTQVKINKPEIDTDHKNERFADPQNTDHKSGSNDDKKIDSQIFKVYSEGQQDSKSENQFHPPEALIKVVNQFEDFEVHNQ